MRNFNFYSIEKVSLNEESDDEITILVDNSNFIMNKEKTKELIKELINSLGKANWDAIDEHNIKRDLIIQEQMNPFREKPKEPKVVKKHKGYIYFIKDDTNNVKIGRTKDSKRRLGEYTRLAFEPIVLNILESNDMVADELHYHEMFAHKHKRGEWFELDKRDINYIKKLKQIVY